ncbi:hypothetical protein DFS33DRAFT_1384983 [Desarmillaria ectypa]|nr:hypothetical protein DFS33DRAFT_1384983 [Desarmillaria ectypa]
MQPQSKRAIVRAYAAEGATVTSVDVNDQIGQAVTQNVSSTGPGTVTYAHLDISDRTQVDAVFKEAAAKNGRAHVLERIYKVNLFGTIYTMMLHMRSCVNWAMAPSLTSGQKRG